MAAQDQCSEKGRPLLCRLGAAEEIETCMADSVKRPRITIGPDCSGMEAPSHALRNLAMDVEHRFASEISENAMRTIKANSTPGITFGDLTERDNSTSPVCDLYVAGFPCQPFSSAVHRKGFGDTNGRGLILTTTTTTSRPSYRGPSYSRTFHL